MPPNPVRNIPVFISLALIPIVKEFCAEIKLIPLSARKFNYFVSDPLNVYKLLFSIFPLAIRKIKLFFT